MKLLTGLLKNGIYTQRRKERDGKTKQNKEEVKQGQTYPSHKT